MKPSLKYLRPQFLPLGKGPHPLWVSCGSSGSAVRAATIVARIISGRYRDDKLVSRWKNTSGACSMCSYVCGDTVHLLSGECPPLQIALNSTLNHSLILLRDSCPELVSPVVSALRKGALEWATFILNPSTTKEVIRLVQEHGSQFIWPLFRLSRAFVWCMHKETTRVKTEMQI